MKIVSWNVNGIRACAKKGLADFLRQEKPDIFCVQETKAHLEQVEPEVQKLSYPNAHWSSAKKKGYSGVATFYRGPAVPFANGFGIEAYDSEGRFLITEHPDFALFNIYFPNGGSGEVRHDFKQQFLADLREHLRSRLAQGRDIIVVGDYNIAHREVDLYDPKRLAKESGFLTEERAWMDQFFGLGFVDTFRQFHPDAKERYSWWSYRELARVGNRGWRIDYISVSEKLRDRVRSAEILDQVEGSDHCPVVIEID